MDWKAKMNGSVINDTSLRTAEQPRGYTVIILAILCLLSICFNSIVMHCLVSNRKKAWARKAKQLLYLVLSDLFAGVFLIPRIIYLSLDRSMKKNEMCPVMDYIIITPQVISFYHVLSLCIHRYLQIRKALLPSLVDTYRYGLESCGIWIASALVCIPPFFFWGRYDEGMVGCRFVDMLGVSDKPAIIYCLVLICLPWILTNVIYVATVLKMISTGKSYPVPALKIEVSETKEEQPCLPQIQTMSVSATEVAGPSQSCNLLQLSKSNKTVAVAGSTTIQKPRINECTTTPNSHHPTDINKDAAIQFSASEQRCYIVKQCESNQAAPVASCSTAPELPCVHKNRTTRYCLHLNVYQDVAVRFSASNQSCSIVQQNPPHQSAAVVEGLTTPEEPQQHGNTKRQETAITEVTESAATAQKHTSTSIIVQVRNRRVVKAIAVLLLAFNISIIPLVLIPFMMMIGKGDAIPKQLQGLAFLNNVLNPFIYTFAFTQLREEVKRTIGNAFRRLRNLVA